MTAAAVPKEAPPLEGIELALVTLGIALSTLLLILDLTIANVALPYIAGDLSVPADQGTYVLTFFAVGSAISLPLTGWLTKRFGTIRTYSVSIVCFIVFSFCCGIAWSLISLVIFRFCQGFFSGPMIPLGQALLANIYPKDKLTQIMALYAMIVLVAPAFGPVVGGYLCITATWRWIFYINIPLGIISVVLIVQSLMQRETPTEKIPVDVVSFILVLLGMTALQIFLDKGYDWDWFLSGKIIILSLTAFISIVYLILYSFIPHHPLMDLRLMKAPMFSLAIGILVMSYALFLGTVVILPLWLETFQGYDAYWAGIAICTNGIGALVCAPIVPKIVEKIGRVIPISLGLILMGIANLANAYFNPQVSLKVVALYRFYAGCPVVLWIVPLMSMPNLALRNDQRPMGMGIFYFFRGITSGVGISLLTTIFQRRTIFHRQAIVETVNNANTAATHYIQHIRSTGFMGKPLTAAVDAELTKQAACMAFNDCFWLVGWGMIFLGCVLLLAAPYDLKYMHPQAHKAPLSVE